MYSIRRLRNTVIRLLTIVTMAFAIGCVLLPELDSFSWEQSYSKHHFPGQDTFLTTLLDNDTDTDGDGSLRVWQSYLEPRNIVDYSPLAFSQGSTKQYSSSLLSVRQKYFLLHRRLLL